MPQHLFAFDMVTLDGFFEGPGQDISWHNVDAEFNDFAIAQLDEIGGLLFGRVTYEGMAAYWPTPASSRDAPEVARRMNDLPKLVYSQTLPAADWSNSRLVRNDLPGAIAALAAETGRDLAVFGSARLTARLLELDLLDELRIMVNPVLLGAGRPLFGDVHGRAQLRLLEARPFRSGNVLLRYATEAAEEA